MRRASSPPLIRDRKIESVNSRSGEVFQQTARMRTDHSTLDIRTSVPTTLPHVNVEYSGSPSHYRADVDGMRVGRSDSRKTTDAPYDRACMSRQLFQQPVRLVGPARAPALGDGTSHHQV